MLYAGAGGGDRGAVFGVQIKRQESPVYRRPPAMSPLAWRSARSCSVFSAGRRQTVTRLNVEDRMVIRAVLVKAWLTPWFRVARIVRHVERTFDNTLII
jgi:hypothetical protein